MKLAWVWFTLAIVVEISRAQKCKARKPKNRHGVEPILLIDKETQLKFDNYLTTIPVLGTEWKVSFYLKYYQNNPNNQGTSTFFMEDSTGNKRPTINGHAGNSRIHVYHFVDGSEKAFTYPLTLNVYHFIEMEQRYISGGNYEFRFSVDGVVIQTSLLTQDIHLRYDVKLYAANKNIPTSPAYIKQLEFVNIF
ncbi:uncharacterized protein [Clytia hemisphaerica]|uniref:Cnidarian restricted protein n=1 Tax=Clytia hemisphaerica TaxID=252671 RepID=A0A7M5TSS4_9CNID|eukprot:TCONS_00006305-protein